MNTDNLRDYLDLTEALRELASRLLTAANEAEGHAHA